MDIIYEPDISYRRASQIDKMWAESDFTGKLYTEILAMASLQGDEVALDVAAGTGCLVQLLSEILAKGRVIGIDPSTAMVRLAQNKLLKKKATNAAVMASPGNDFIFRDSMFDAVFCVLGLYHFADPLKGLNEMKRVLKTGGELILCEPEAPDDARLREVLSESFQLAHPNYRFFSGGELYSLVTDAGFSRQKSATEQFAFDQHGVAGIPMGVHYLETHAMIQRRKQQDLLDKFERNLFRVSGEMMRVRGKLNFALLRAAKK
jgi:ubiquinone/menaquinone biosynthesis C-methylase UbiE